MMFATGPGSMVQRPLAIVVVGGLFTSTLATLIVLPILMMTGPDRGRSYEGSR